MTALITAEVGHGPDIVLLHGVGAGPDTFAELATRLADGHRVLIIERPGGDGAVVPLANQAAAVADTMVTLGAVGGLVVGVSGGATLAVLLGVEHREVVGGLVAHEPLLGPLVPPLHECFAAAAERARRGEREAMEVVQSLLGSRTWQELDPSARARIAAGASRARGEIPLFAGFSPTVEELQSLHGLPLLTTVGERSDPARFDVAAVLAALAGAQLAVVPGAGNAVQLDAPAAFADAICAWWGASMCEAI